MLKMNEQFFCLCTKVWLRLLKKDDFDMDLMLRKHTHTHTPKKWPQWSMMDSPQGLFLSARAREGEQFSRFWWGLLIALTEGSHPSWTETDMHQIYPDEWWSSHLNCLGIKYCFPTGAKIILSACKHWQCLQGFWVILAFTLGMVVTKTHSDTVPC